MRFELLRSGIEQRLRKKCTRYFEECPLEVRKEVSRQGVIIYYTIIDSRLVSKNKTIISSMSSSCSDTEERLLINLFIHSGVWLRHAREPIDSFQQMIDKAKAGRLNSPPFCCLKKNVFPITQNSILYAIMTGWRITPYYF